MTHPHPGTPVGVTLVTPDLGAARQFYGDLLGWVFTEVDGDRVDAYRDTTPVATLLAAHTAPVAGWTVRLAAGPDPASTIPAAGGRVLDTRDGLIYAADPAGAVFTVTDSASAVAQPTVEAPAGAAVPGPPPPGLPVWYENMTTDPAAADAFYRAVFGLATVPAGPPGAPDPAGQDPAGPDYVLFAAGGRPVAGRLALPPDLATALGPRWMVYLAQPDVDAAAQRAADLGAGIAVPPRDAPTGRVSAVVDPGGAVFTLIRPA